MAEFHSIRKISTDGIVTTIAGSGGEQGFVHGPGHSARSNVPHGMALAASGMLIVCDCHNNRLRRVDPNNGHVTTIERPFERHRDVARSSDGMLYVTARDGLHEISSADGAVSRLAPSFEHDNGGLLRCHIDEPNGLFYASTGHRIFTISVSTASEWRAARIFPLFLLWSLTQRDRAGTMVNDTIGTDEANVRAVLLRLMRLRVVGVLGLVLHFAFG